MTRDSGQQDHGGRMGLFVGQTAWSWTSLNNSVPVRHNCFPWKVLTHPNDPAYKLQLSRQASRAKINSYLMSFVYQSVSKHSFSSSPINRRRNRAEKTRTLLAAFREYMMMICGARKWNLIWKETLAEYGVLGGRKLDQPRFASSITYPIGMEHFCSNRWRT